MKRIDIYYGGEHYSVANRRPEELRKEIDTGLLMGTHWLNVNFGEGFVREAQLLLTPGVPLAVVPIPDEAPELRPDAVWSEGGPPLPS